MELQGAIQIADLNLQFVVEKGVARYTVTKGKSMECVTASAQDFLCALAIAVHMNADPDAARDYMSAEYAQPVNPDLRFIP